jgi:hypothetical protein
LLLLLIVISRKGPESRSKSKIKSKRHMLANSTAVLPGPLLDRNPQEEREEQRAGYILI